MGLFSGTKKKKARDYLKNILFSDEEAINTYKFMRNSISVTDRRLIIIKKSLFSREVTIKSIPYHKIDQVSVEKNRKLFAISNKIYINNNGEKIKFKIAKGEKIMELYNKIVQSICYSQKQFKN